MITSIALSALRDTQMHQLRTTGSVAILNGDIEPLPSVTTNT